MTDGFDRHDQSERSCLLPLTLIEKEKRQKSFLNRSQSRNNINNQKHYLCKMVQILKRK